MILLSNKYIHRAGQDFVQNKGQHLLCVSVASKILETLKNPCVDTNGSFSNSGEGEGLMETEGVVE